MKITVAAGAITRTTIIIVAMHGIGNVKKIFN